MNRVIPHTELILNPDGSIYHIKLKPNDIADTVILTGDPGRVEEVSCHFDNVELRKENREFRTHTGYYKGKRLTVMSTGIGSDNIDIAVNELDALVNIDFKKRGVRKKKKSLNLIRIGTSGGLQPEIPCDSFVVSSYGLGFDGLMNYYKSIPLPSHATHILRMIKKHLNPSFPLNNLYVVPGDRSLITTIGQGMLNGITATATGFYGPQGRKLRLQPAIPDLPDLLSMFRFENHKITNFEMETSALYGLAYMLGHRACTVCAIIANRPRKEYSRDHHSAVKKLISMVLDRCMKL